MPIFYKCDILLEKRQLLFDYLKIMLYNKNIHKINII